MHEDSDTRRLHQQNLESVTIFILDTNREMSYSQASVAQGLMFIVILVLARTGLIFTGIQEGAQPGGGG